MDLNTLIDAATGAPEPDARQQCIRAALAQHPDANLGELETAAAAEFKTLSEPGPTGFSTEAVTRMEVIADVVDALRAEHGDRTRSAATVADLAGRVSAPGIAATTPEPTAPATPQPEQPTPAPQPDTPQPEQPSPAPGNPAEPPSAPEPQHQPSADLVLAGGGPSTAPARRAPQVPMSALPVQVPEDRRAGSPYVITAAADLPGINLGADLVDLDGLTRAVMARFGQLSRAGGDIGGTRAGIGSIVIERDSKLVAETQHDYQVIDYACNETRLPGGSLIAAGAPGWCAPAEISYEFCPVAVVDGLVDLPSVTARRGSLVYPQSPEFHTIYSGNTGFSYTAAQIDEMQTPGNTTVKPCYKVTCPDTTTVSLDPIGMCIQASILHERAYPELIKYTVDQSLVAHAHRINASILAQMAALATPVDLTGNLNLGPGAAATILEAIELQVEWLRYRHRLGINQTMEMVAPVWMRGILRADLSKRMGVDLLNVNDATLNTYLTARGVRIQWVLDWQDSFSDPATVPGPPERPVTIPESTLFGGGAAPQTAWPTTAQVLIYPAGTYFLARMDVINIEGGLLDSTLLRKNERLVLFIEEAMKVGKRCFQSSLVEFNLCASGQTGSGAWTACATAPKIAA